jgi:hypothetical protein
MHRQSERNH